MPFLLKIIFYYCFEVSCFFKIAHKGESMLRAPLELAFLSAVTNLIGFTNPFKLRITAA
jgi:hypothetical protein